MPHPVTCSPVLVAALARIRCVPREQVMRIVVVLFLIAAIHLRRLLEGWPPHHQRRQGRLRSAKRTKR